MPVPGASAEVKIPTLVHLMAGVWIVSMGLYGVLAPDRYQMLLQEDRSVEWVTLWLFLMAGATGLLRSGRERRLADGFVALFCLFAAGEEISWGQRLAGYVPAEFFLANNFQQEANLHNLPQSFLQPKWMLIVALGAYGTLLPVIARRGSARPLLDRIGATAPPLELMPWWTAGIVLLLWYPLTLTGEWVEALAGALFLISADRSMTASGIRLALAIVLATAASYLAGPLERGGDVERIACASHEVRNLATDIASGTAGTDRLWAMSHVHKRLRTSADEGYVQPDQLRSFNQQVCADDQTVGRRDEYGIDPWGSPYWLLVETIGEQQRRVTVYSFGPNRRRDFSDAMTPDAVAGDDIRDVRVITAPAAARPPTRTIRGDDASSTTLKRVRSPRRQRVFGRAIRSARR